MTVGTLKAWLNKFPDTMLVKAFNPQAGSDGDFEEMGANQLIVEEQGPEEMDLTK